MDTTIDNVYCHLLKYAYTRLNNPSPSNQTLKIYYIKRRLDWLYDHYRKQNCLIIMKWHTIRQKLFDRFRTIIRNIRFKTVNHVSSWSASKHLCVTWKPKKIEDIRVIFIIQNVRLNIYRHDYHNKMHYVPSFCGLLTAWRLFTSETELKR